jgi:hypothetical protein
MEDGAAFYGVYGGRGMTEVLTTVRGHWRRLSLYSSILNIFGQLLLFLL